MTAWISCDLCLPVGKDGESLSYEAIVNDIEKVTQRHNGNGEAAYMTHYLMK